MAGVESSEGRKRHEEKAVRRTLEFPCARQLGKGRTFFFFLIWREFCFIMGFPSGTVVKNVPAVQETWVRSLSLEDLLEKEMSTHSSIPARKVPWTEEPDCFSPWDCKR